MFDLNDSTFPALIDCLHDFYFINCGKGGKLWTQSRLILANPASCVY